MAGGKGSGSSEEGCEDSVDAWTAAVHVPYNCFLCVSLTAQLSFTAVFIRNLRRSDKLRWNHPLARTVLIYLLCSVLAMTGSFYLSVVQPMIQTRFSRDLDSCRTIVLLSWVFGSMTYFALLEVFILRLNLVYTGTEFEVDRRVHQSFRAVFSTVLLICLVFLSMKAAVTNCWVEKKLGILGDLPIFPKSYRTCTTDPKLRLVDHWMIQVPSGLLAITIIGGTALLLRMYISRLKTLNDKRDNKHYSMVIEKTTVVSVFGMISTLMSFAILIGTSFYAIIFIDHVINSVMLFMLFSWADPLYHYCFDWIVEKIRDHFDILPTLDRALHRVMSVQSMTSVASMDSAGHRSVDLS